MLKPEKAWEYETGIIQNFKPLIGQPLTGRTTFYYYDIQDFINDNGITSPGTGLGTDCLFNIPSVKMYGIELEVAMQLKRFRGMISYNYMTTISRKPPS